MSQKDNHRSPAPEGAKAATTASRAGTGASWEEKLRKAREKRAEVIAARGGSGDPDPGSDSSSETDDVPAPAIKNALVVREPSLVASPTNAPVVQRAILVFAAAFGIGLGGVVGIGLIATADRSLLAVSSDDTGVAVGTQTAQNRQSDVLVDAPENVNAPIGADTGQGVDTETAANGAVEGDTTEDVAAVMEPAPVTGVAETQEQDAVDELVPVLMPAQTDVAQPPEETVVPASAPQVVASAVDPPAPAAPRIDVPRFTEFADVSYARPSDAATRRPLSAPPSPDGVQELPERVAQFDTVSVYLHVPNAVPRARVNDLITSLGEIGVDVAKVGQEPFRVSETHMRYYSPDLADKAAALGDVLGIEARYFSRSTPLDRVEIWVGGRARDVAQDNGLLDNFIVRALRRLAN